MSLIDTLRTYSHFEDIPSDWRAWQHIDPSEEVKQGRPVLLFRTHAMMGNTQLRIKEADGLVHASPAPIFPSDIRYNSNFYYGGGSERFTFITVYEAGPKQEFYKDEELEFVKRGCQIQGHHIEYIQKFNPKLEHFETNANGLKVIGVFAVTLPPKKDSIIRPAPVNIDTIKIMRVDHIPNITEIVTLHLNPQTPWAKRLVEIAQLSKAATPDLIDR